MPEMFRAFAGSGTGAPPVGGALGSGLAEVTSVVFRMSGSAVWVGLSLRMADLVTFSSDKKGIWWMPWHREAMKDVAPCDKLRGDGSDL